MKYKYGDFSENQISINKKRLRKQIYFLLLCAENPEKYPNININDAFNSILYEIGGLNSVLYEPPEIVRVVSLLEAALIEYNNNFDFNTYRKLILDAGAEVLLIKEV